MPGGPSTVCEPTTLLHRDMPRPSNRRIKVEGEFKTLSIIDHAISLYEDKWLIIRPADTVAFRIQDFQKSIPGYQHSDLGVCQPHEYLAVDSNRSAHCKIAQDQLELMLKRWDLSSEANWNQVGHHAALALLALCKGKWFDVGKTRAALRRWRSQVCERKVRFADAWDLRRQGIALVLPFARIPLPTTWYKATT
ncbi:hypothetical protein LTS08_006592 [Lithohypha guttulata]|uniref:Uncharacterized protein n=1 Tax=Lithohypha guttulata TaxID=1690604 RepID=A0ABR0K0J3_9EURO|nr:hypothetical protein LTR51_000949 [Lithohypha guttulata]KAK5081412.1 hypothetical protein LTR24_008218 [Lithohypha guttulata]KAK5097837.1 hypothetical protein LTS08_006592 [Lithohypha guttulata]KAK5313841.1 hypothetical protein LTR70_007415 [Exophiala xenobiotica]